MTMTRAGDVARLGINALRLGGRDKGLLYMYADVEGQLHGPLELPQSHAFYIEDGAPRWGIYNPDNGLFFGLRDDREWGVIVEAVTVDGFWSLAYVYHEDLGEVVFSRQLNGSNEEVNPPELRVLAEQGDNYTQAFLRCVLRAVMRGQPVSFAGAGAQVRVAS